MAKIIMLAPFPDSSPLTKFAKEEYRHVPDLFVLGTDTGLDVITSYHHIEYHLGPILDKALKIEKQGDCDAIIIGCFGDPGLIAVRQVTSMPVLGTGETSLCLAAMVGDKIGIIVPQRDLIYVTEKMIHTYQFTDRVVSIRSTEELFAMSFFFRKREAVGSGTERKSSAKEASTGFTNTVDDSCLHFSHSKVDTSTHRWIFNT